MGILSISGSSSDAGIQQSYPQFSPQNQPAPLPGTGAPSADTVQLTQAAQIQQMALQGESAAEIASDTGLTISVIDSDLGISASSSAPAAAPGGHGGGNSSAAAHGTTASASAPTASSASTLSVRA
ncbi:MAG: hypothetical protein WBY75_10285 [Terracidiphilus sp.]